MDRKKLTIERSGGNRENLIMFDPSEQSDLKNIKPKNITLVASPWVFDDEAEFQSQQLGLGYVGAYAEKFGHQIVAFIDPMIDGGNKIKVPLETKYRLTHRFGHPDSEIVRRIPKDVDLIGLNAPFTDSRITGYPLIDAIKDAFPSIPLVIGGVLATTLTRQVLEESRADIIVKGEGEIAFARIANGEPLVQIPGVMFRQSDGSLYENPSRSEQLRNIDSIPTPGYHFRPMEDYVSWSPRGDRARRTLSIISSRGCPFTCEFCSIPEKGQRWRPFTPERIINEIDMCIERFGVNHIEFEDDNFTLRQDRAIPILQHIAHLRKSGYPIECSFPNGIMIDKMSSELTLLLKQAGTDIVYLPVESGDTRVLVSMDKPNADGHLDKTREIARYCVEAGLLTSCFFIVAYPGGAITKNKYLRPEYNQHLIYDGDKAYMRGEGEESFETTLNFCRELRQIGVQGITPLIATPYPGTELYHVCDKFDWLSFKDEKDVLTTVSYAHMKPKYVQIVTPYCSQTRAYERWQEMSNLFPGYHNVRRFEGDRDHVPTQEVASREKPSI
ncbi:B12-binding domain-containing radical SAM protein [Desulfobacterota bacterium AH_259_B03_O07]|nr:B12-binding domain-containing radical SAM protein [Desulfobacterota bacterium AH_259_B03_O07]